MLCSQNSVTATLCLWLFLAAPVAEASAENYQDVEFVTKPEGASVEVIAFNQPDHSFSVRTPASIPLSVPTDYVVTFRLPGFHTVSIPLTAKTDGAEVAAGLGLSMLAGGWC